MSEPYPERLVILPLENKVLLPSVIFRLLIRGKQATDLTKAYFRQQNNSQKGTPNHQHKDVLIACIPLRPLVDHASSTAAESISSQAPQMPGMPLSLTQATADSKTITDHTTSVHTSAIDGGNDNINGLVALKDHSRLMNYGCVARIIRVQRSGTNMFGVFVEGIARFKVATVSQNTTSMPFPGCWVAHAQYSPFSVVHDHRLMNNSSNTVDDFEVMTESERAIVEKFKHLSRIFVIRMKELKLPDALLAQLTKVVESKPISSLADLLISLIETTFDEKFLMLSTPALFERLDKACEFMTRQLHVLQITDNLGIGIDGKLGKKQREFYLRQQLEAIDEEDNGSDSRSRHSSSVQQKPEDDEMAELHKRLVEANLPNEVVTVAQREMNRLKRLQPSSSEWAVSRNYLDWIADLPWDVDSPQKIDIERSKKQLQQDHFGLDHVKKRILEYLSVIKLKKDLKAPILCLVGPPGVGKTSLGRSIAQSMTREFHRISLGGVRDEADMRGHRRTYVGAMPGLLIQGLRKCKVRNPVFLLDEIDKLGRSAHHGDPAAALLEVLDPEQNSSFSDHYLNVPFDLSNILFIATANSLETIPEPLLDRMEVIEINGYTFEEKLHIAKTYLVPKQTLAHGLQLHQINIDDDAILSIAENYTRESGVRQLERQVASVIRAKCMQYSNCLEGARVQEYEPHIAVSDIEALLGPVKFEKEVSERDPYPGVVTGLAYSSSGNGGILFVEASKMPGDGNLHLTGSLGNVIQESAKLALSWVKSNAHVLKLTSHSQEKLAEHDDIHIHFPGGSVPKDGPSAGVTLVCALISLYAERNVPSTTAMTGEISLRGQVLPVGGIKEKVISAHRAGIRKIIIPARNKKDVETDVPESVRAEIEFIFAGNIWQVLEAAFECQRVELTSRRQPLVESHL